MAEGLKSMIIFSLSLLTYFIETLNYTEKKLYGQAYRNV